MASRPISLLRKGLYWSLACIVGAGLACPAAGAQSKSRSKASKAKAATSKPARAAADDHDPLTEWELVNGGAIELREKINRQPRNDALRQRMADLAVRSAVGAERAFAVGDASLFDSYSRQFRELFPDTHWRLSRLAQGGSGAADYALGVVSLHGFLDASDVPAACARFGAAVGRGYGAAKFRLSQCLQKSDPVRSATLLREAAASGHPVAAELAGRTCLEAKPQDAACAWDQLTIAAAAGRPSAQSLLAWMTVQGVGGHAPDIPRAMRLYQQAARAGDASAQNNMGELYETGRGVSADVKQAADWYRKAAKGGFAPAQFNLGRLYADGRGVARDLAEARKWLERADQAGVAPAKKALEWVEQQERAVK
jgi:TPR repeat protein